MLHSRRTRSGAPGAVIAGTWAPPKPRHLVRARTNQATEQNEDYVDDDKIDSVVARMRSQFAAAKSSIKSWFREIDTDGSGAIDSSEMFTLLKEMGVPLSLKECGALINRFDNNENEEMEMDDFVDLVCGEAELTSLAATASALEFIHNPEAAMRSSAQAPNMTGAVIVSGGQAQRHPQHALDSTTRAHATTWTIASGINEAALARAQAEVVAVSSAAAQKQQKAARQATTRITGMPQPNGRSAKASALTRAHAQHATRAIICAPLAWEPAACKASTKPALPVAAQQRAHKLRAKRAALSLRASTGSSPNSTQDVTAMAVAASQGDGTARSSVHDSGTEPGNAPQHGDDGGGPPAVFGSDTMCEGALKLLAQAAERRRAQRIAAASAIRKERGHLGREVRSAHNIAEELRHQRLDAAHRLGIQRLMPHALPRMAPEPLPQSECSNQWLTKPPPHEVNGMSSDPTTHYDTMSKLAATGLQILDQADRKARRQARISKIRHELTQYNERIKARDVVPAAYKNAMREARFQRAAAELHEYDARIQQRLETEDGPGRLLPQHSTPVPELELPSHAYASAASSAHWHGTPSARSSRSALSATVRSVARAGSRGTSQPNTQRSAHIFGP